MLLAMSSSYNESTKPPSTRGTGHSTPNYRCAYASSYSAKLQWTDFKLATLRILFVPIHIASSCIKVRHVCIGTLQ